MVGNRVGQQHSRLGGEEQNENKTGTHIRRVLVADYRLYFVRIGMGKDLPKAAASHFFAVSGSAETFFGDRRAMKERPIIFSAPMVRAILDGRKTQTRRTVKPQLVGGDTIIQGWSTTGFQVGRMRDSENAWRDLRCPYGSVGDQLWVRETFALHDHRDPPIVYYRADDPTKYESDGAWKPSIHMPRWASRITLEITKISVERLQEISEGDAVAEGAMEWWNGLTTAQQAKIYNGKRGPQAAFQMLWDSINGDSAWEKNPWVWVIEFRRVP